MHSMIKTTQRPLNRNNYNACYLYDPSKLHYIKSKVKKTVTCLSMYKNLPENGNQISYGKNDGQQSYGPQSTVDFVRGHMIDQGIAIHGSATGALRRRVV